LITATGGNVSVRIRGPTRSGSRRARLFKGNLRPEILVRIDLDGQPLDADARSPSSERLMHCASTSAARRRRPIIHAHAPHATHCWSTPAYPSCGVHEARSSATFRASRSSCRHRGAGKRRRRRGAPRVGGADAEPRHPRRRASIRRAADWRDRRGSADGHPRLLRGEQTGDNASGRRRAVLRQMGICSRESCQPISCQPSAVS